MIRPRGANSRVVLCLRLREALSAGIWCWPISGVSRLIPTSKFMHCFQPYLTRRIPNFKGSVYIHTSLMTIPTWLGLPHMLVGDGPYRAVLVPKEPAATELKILYIIISTRIISPQPRRYGDPPWFEPYNDIIYRIPQFIRLQRPPRINHHRPPPRVVRMFQVPS